MFRKNLGESAYMGMLGPHHARALYNLIEANRDHLRQWLPWVDITVTPRDSQMWIQGALKQFADNRELHAGIWWQDSLAGVIGGRFNWQHQYAILGYWLGADFQGKGLVTRACQAMVNHCFSSLGLNRVEIRCATENLRSRAIPQRLGFKQEGVIREAEFLYDHYVDHVVYGLLAREWAQNIYPDPKFS